MFLLKRRKLIYKMYKKPQGLAQSLSAIVSETLLVIQHTMYVLDFTRTRWRYTKSNSLYTGYHPWKMGSAQEFTEECWVPWTSFKRSRGQSLELATSTMCLTQCPYGVKCCNQLPLVYTKYHLWNAKCQGFSYEFFFGKKMIYKIPNDASNINCRYW